MNLQVELFGGLSRHKLHRGALDRLSDCLGLAESRSSVPWNMAVRTSPALAWHHGRRLGAGWGQGRANLAAPYFSSLCPADSVSELVIPDR